MALIINPKNMGKIARRELPNRLVPREGGDTGLAREKILEAEAWCAENLGINAFRCDKGREPNTEKWVFLYHGRWTRLGKKFFFRQQADATAFKLVWG